MKSNIRYINKQQHTSSCGPVAILNAIKWLGGKVGYRTHIQWFKGLGWTDQYGTFHHSLAKMLNYFGISYKKLMHPTIQDLEVELYNGNAIILDFTEYFRGENQGGHYTFITRQTNKQFHAINFIGDPEDKINNWVNKRLLAKWFRISKTYEHQVPCAWIIEK